MKSTDADTRLGAILDEAQREPVTIRREDRYVPRDRRIALLFRLARLVEIVEIVQTVREWRDPDDDKFLELALNGRADVIVSGDRDLLALHPFCGIPILTPAAFLARPEDAR